MIDLISCRYNQWYQYWMACLHVFVFFIIFLSQVKTRQRCTLGSLWAPPAKVVEQTLLHCPPAPHTPPGHSRRLPVPPLPPKPPQKLLAPLLHLLWPPQTQAPPPPQQHFHSKMQHFLWLGRFLHRRPETHLPRVESRPPAAHHHPHPQRPHRQL